MEAYFSTKFEDVKRYRSLILILSLTDPDRIKESKFTDDEINVLKNLGSRKYISV